MAVSVPACIRSRTSYVCRINEANRATADISSRQMICNQRCRHAQLRRAMSHASPRSHPIAPFHCSTKRCTHNHTHHPRAPASGRAQTSTGISHHSCCHARMQPATGTGTPRITPARHSLPLSHTERTHTQHHATHTHTHQHEQPQQAPDAHTHTNTKKPQIFICTSSKQCTACPGLHSDLSGPSRGVHQAGLVQLR
jgi:hypothetical protein